MRRAVSIVLISCLMLQFVLQVGLITYFSINQKQIAIEFCINKNKPGSCCEGKCYLDKQLSGLEKDGHTDKQVKEQESPVFFIPDNRIAWMRMEAKTIHAGEASAFLNRGYLYLEKKPPRKYS